jgi:hypothetical protein
MFRLTKPFDLGRDRVPLELERVVGPLALSVDDDGRGVTYKISAFAPRLRYSMFVPFSEVSLSRETSGWVLQLKLSKVLLLPFAFSAFGFAVFRTMGPISGPDAALFLAMPQRWS